MIDTPISAVTAAAIEQRIVRYADLKPCLNAFVDSRTPGSDRKENFTIIGPGVSENPNQYVHIRAAHGFNIGGARQPPGCVNSQHSHETAEVFVVHSGHWRFDFGEHGEDASVEAGPGDVVSFPTRVFRGFTNIGKNADRSDFLWAVLGGDDPGRVTWAPSVFALARDHGLVLLENGSLVDTANGERIPDGIAPMAPTDQAMVGTLKRLTPKEAERLIARAPVHPAPGETRIIGPGGALGAVDDFTLDRIDLYTGDIAGVPTGREVLFVNRGQVSVIVDDEAVELGEGDTMTIPPGPPRLFRSSGKATVFAVRN